MKKILITLICLFFIKNNALAMCDYTVYCPQIPSSLESNSINLFSQMSGGNYLAEQFANNMLAGELKKATGQDFAVNIQAFSVNDLLKGRFKNLEISGNNVVVGGVYLSSVKLKTLCPYNSINLRSSPIRFEENAVARLQLELSANDLRNSITSGGYSNFVNSANLKSIGIASYYIYPNTINISDNKIYFTINAKPTSQYPPMDIYISGDLLVQNGVLYKTQFNFINVYAGYDLARDYNFVNSLNNLVYTTRIFNGQNALIQLENLYILNNAVHIDAIVLINRI